MRTKNAYCIYMLIQCHRLLECSRFFFFFAFLGFFLVCVLSRIFFNTAPRSPKVGKNVDKSLLIIAVGLKCSQSQVYHIVIILVLLVTTICCSLLVRSSLVPRPSSLVGKNKGEEGLVKLIT